jgi:hypothetical protein
MKDSDSTVDVTWVSVVISSFELAVTTPTPRRRAPMHDHEENADRLLATACATFCACFMTTCIGIFDKHAVISLGFGG